MKKRTGAGGVIHADDWFKDRSGKRWAVKAVDLDRREVRLRLVDPPERVVSVDVLRKSYELAGFRAAETVSETQKGKRRPPRV